jgi:hypothetical protein
MAEIPTYLEGTWSGLPLYVCLADGYNTFSLDQLTTHLLEMHDLTPVELVE